MQWGHEPSVIEVLTKAGEDPALQTLARNSGALRQCEEQVEKGSWRAFFRQSACIGTNRDSSLVSYSNYKNSIKVTIKVATKVHGNSSCSK